LIQSFDFSHMLEIAPPAIPGFADVFRHSFDTFVGAFLALPITISFFVCALLTIAVVLTVFIIKAIFGLRGTSWLVLPAAVILMSVLIPAHASLTRFLNRRKYRRGDIIPLECAADAPSESCGFKARGISHLFSLGFRTAPGFVINGLVFEKFARTGKIESSIIEASGGDGAEEKIRELISSRQLPPRLVKKIRKAVAALGCECVIVRSSFPGEDGGKSSMAGVFKSVETTTDDDSLREAIIKVWASYFSAAASSLRANSASPATPLRLPVIIQEYIDHDAIVLSSSVNPLNGLTEEMISDCRSGDNESLVVHNLLTGSVGPVSGEEPPFSDGELRRIAGCLLALEAEFGKHYQIEAGKRDDRLYFHQARPLTGFKSAETLVNSFIVDIVDDPLTPFSKGLFGMPDSLDSMIRTRFSPFGLSTGDKIITEHSGRYYLRYNTVRKFLNPRFFSSLRLAIKTIPESRRNIAGTLFPGSFRKTIVAARSNIGGIAQLGLSGYRARVILPLFKCQFELFYLSDFIASRMEALARKVLDPGRELETALSILRTPSRTTPYEEMLDRLSELDFSDSGQVERFKDDFGHWGTPEAEAAARRFSAYGPDDLGKLSGIPRRTEYQRKEAAASIEKMLDEAWKENLINPAKALFRFSAGRLGEILYLREVVRDLLNRAVSESGKFAEENFGAPDCFFAIPHELESGTPPAEAIEKRKAEYEKYMEVSPGPVVHIPETDVEPAPDGVIAGMGVGMEKASGPAVVNPATPSGIAGGGKVLVINSPDPVYGSAVGRISALVIERGSPLSHLVVLAREHGLPVLVGAAGACDRVKAGAIVEVDAGKGWLKVVS